MGELARTVEAIRTNVREDLMEFGRRLDQLVLREVYLADQRAVQAEIARLQEDIRTARAEREQDRRAIRTSVYGAIGSVIVAIVILIITLALKGSP